MGCPEVPLTAEGKVEMIEKPARAVKKRKGKEETGHGGAVSGPCRYSKQDQS
jgi:hypothetical protein